MSSTATVRAYRLVRPSTLIILISQTRQTCLLTFGQRTGASVLAPNRCLKFHDKEHQRTLSTLWRLRRGRGSGAGARGKVSGDAFPKLWRVIGNGRLAGGGRGQGDAFSKVPRTI